MVDAILVQGIRQDQIPVRLSVIDRQCSRFTGLGFHFLQLAVGSCITVLHPICHVIDGLVAGRDAVIGSELGHIFRATLGAQVKAVLVQMGRIFPGVPHVDVRHPIEHFGQADAEAAIFRHHPDVLVSQVCQGICIGLAAGDVESLVQPGLHHVLLRRIGAGSHIVVPGEPQPIFQRGNFMGIAHIAVAVGQPGGGIGAGQRRGTHGGRDVGLGLIHALQAQHAVGTGGAVLLDSRFRGQGCHTAVLLTNVQSIQLQLPIQVHIQDPVISYAGSDVAGGIRIGATENLQGISQVPGITGEDQALHIVVRADDGVRGRVGNISRFHVGDFLATVIQAISRQGNPLGPDSQGQASTIDSGGPKVGTSQSSQFLAQFDRQGAVRSAGLDPDIAVAEFGRIRPAFNLEIMGGSVFPILFSSQLPGNDIGPGYGFGFTVNLHLGIVSTKSQSIGKGCQMMGMAGLIRIFQAGHLCFAFAVRIVKITARDGRTGIGGDYRRSAISAVDAYVADVGIGAVRPQDHRIIHPAVRGVGQS